MISLEGRIARIEITLAAIHSKLPGFIKDQLGKTIRDNIIEMHVDALRTIETGKDVDPPRVNENAILEFRNKNADLFKK